jgi:lipoprotein-anchoring transpeptidase ErfK/SrfK
MKKAIIIFLALGLFTFISCKKKQEPSSDAQNTGNAQPGATAQTPGNNQPGNFTADPQNPPSGQVPQDASALISQGDAAAGKGDLLQARGAYSSALLKIIEADNDFPGRDDLLNQLKTKIIGLNKTIYNYGDSVYGWQETYQVKTGETLTAIAPRYKVPIAYLGKLNGMAPPYNNLRAGQTLKVIQGPFHAIVDLSEKRLYVFHGDYFYRDYQISVGKAETATPLDKYTVKVKMDDSMSTFSWTTPEGKVLYPKDPGFMLGTRWIELKGDKGIKTGIGIHGRNPADDDQPLGEVVSHGCIRMRNRDVEELYNLLVPDVSRVTVQP